MFEVNDSELLPRLWFRGRGLDELQERLGSVESLIDDAIARRGVARVLEVGFGYGAVLVQLGQKYGPRIDLHGLNQRVDEGNWEIIQWNAIRGGLATEESIRDLRPPTLHFGDVVNRLPFPSGSFDVVFSQVSFFLFNDKALFIEEVGRVLAPDGIARIDVMPLVRKGVPSNYASLFEIWEGGEEVKFWNYIERFPSLMKRERQKPGYCLEIRSNGAPAIGLTLIASIDLKAICNDWVGTKSVYRVG